MKQNYIELIEEAREYHAKLGKVLDKLEGSEQPEDIHQLEDWQKQRIALWCKIYNEGGVVTMERLKEIWSSHDKRKNNRGIGGFFVGKRASLSWNAEGKVSLTRYASDTILEWTGKEISEVSKQYK